MQVYKFGGTSLADASCFQRVAGILSDQVKQGKPIAVVLSAPGGATNHLISLIQLASSSQDYNDSLRELQERLSTMVAEIGISLSSDETKALQATMTQTLDQIANWLKGIALIGHCPDSLYAEISSTGERISVALMTALLNAVIAGLDGLSARAICPKDFLVAEGSYLDAEVNWPETQRKFAERGHQNPGALVMPGFVAANRQGETVTLGRNGSDYSASILAVCLKAVTCDIWTDVDGIYSCDPRLVPEANLLATISYEEAMELSYFGAKVIHQKMIAPLALAKIPCRIRNTWKPGGAGTLISRPGDTEPGVKAISRVDSVATLSLSGPGMRLRPGLTGRVFDLLAREQVPIFLVTQSSSQYDICFCIPDHAAANAKEMLDNVFDLEIASGQLRELELEPNLAIISVVGDGMRTTIGIAAGFLQALSDNTINIVAIAQGSSERSISVVVKKRNADLAIECCHQRLLPHPAKQTVNA